MDPLGSDMSHLPMIEGNSVEYTRSTDPSLTFAYEIGSDLSSWSTAVQGVDYTESASPNGDVETVTVTLLGDAPRKAFRIRVSD